MILIIDTDITSSEVHPDDLVEISGVLKLRSVYHKVNEDSTITIFGQKCTLFEKSMSVLMNIIYEEFDNIETQFTPRYGEVCLHIKQVTP